MDIKCVILWLDKKIEEDTIMKTATASRTVRPAYPNAADRRYYLRKLLDAALGLAILVGAISALVFLFLM